MTDWLDDRLHGLGSGQLGVTCWVDGLVIVSVKKLPISRHIVGSPGHMSGTLDYLYASQKAHIYLRDFVTKN